MEKERLIGAEVKSLSNLLRRQLDDALVQAELGCLTGMQGWIIGFLVHHPDQDVFQRDVETEFEIRRSTATGILQLMERKGLLVRQPVDYDARLKKLVLTPAALALHAKIKKQIERCERTLHQALTEQETEAFFATMEKLKKALE